MSTFTPEVTAARRARFAAKIAGMSMPAGYVNGVMTYTNPAPVSAPSSTPESGASA